MELSGFTSLELVHEGGAARVFRARRVADDRRVVLKVLRGPHPTAEAVRRFRTEAAITRQVQGAGVIELLEARLDDALPLMVLEDFGGRSLTQLLDAGRRWSPQEGIELVLNALAALTHAHQQLVVHNDVNPSNLVLNPDTGQLKLIDFGIASTVSRQRPQLESPSVLRGTLAYISPEQTGRMNRAVDFRSDYYALGITLYQLASGRTPFQGEDPLELVHAHVARSPPDPRDFEPLVGEDLVAVLRKLLSKTADDRYQSSFGLRQDLERCLESARGDRPATSFLLGRADRPAVFQPPGRLYGREAEISALTQALGRVAKGRREVVLVEGHAGIGKTSLVNELHRPMVETGGLFVSGKFEQFRRGQPYASLAQAFGELCLSLLTEAATALARWRRQLADAVGDAGQVLVDLIPELELVIGPQSPAPQVPPAEAEQRLNRLFLRMVRALTGPGHPLVLFVDDLQWADLPTIRLFNLLAMADDTSHLLIIGAWRGNEIGAGHALAHALDELDASATRVTKLAPGLLSASDVRSYLQDCLRQEGPDIDALAETCLARTGGNPFFLAQFLRTLAAREALYLDGAAGRWVWAPERVEALGITDNVLELMEGTIQRLPAQSRRLLRIASILGASPTLADLAQLSEDDAATLRDALRPIQEEGLLVLVHDGLGADGGRAETYAFVHDRVQQAADQLLSTAERARLHLRAGEMLQRRHPDLESHDALFDAVAHLNAAQAELEPARRVELARLDLAAGRRARQAAAYDVAVELLQTALALLGRQPFEHHPDLAFTVHDESATAAYLAQDYAGSDHHVDVLLDHAPDAMAQVGALEVRMASHIARHQSDEAIAVGLDALKRLGLELPEHPDMPTVQAAMIGCGEVLASADLAGLPAAPVLDDPRQQAMMRLLVQLSPPAYLVRPLLMALLSTSIVRSTVLEGLAPASAYGFALYGLMLCDAGFIDEGYAMGGMAVALTQRFPDERRVRVRSLHVVNGFVKHWREPIHGYLDDYTAVFHDGIDAGDFEYAHFAAMLTGMLGYHAGVPLERFEPLLSRFTRSMTELSQETAKSLHCIVHQAALNLMGQAEDPFILTGSVYDEAQWRGIFEQLQHPTGLFVLHCWRCLNAMALGDPQRALAAADLARPHMAAGGTATFHLPAFNTIDAILCLWDHEQTGAPERLEQAQAARDKVKTWATGNEHNLRQKDLLIQAEFARFEGRSTDALDAYDAAIVAAQDNRFLSDEALCHRLLARFFADRGNNVSANAHLAEARYALQRWGAQAAVALLDEEHPDLVAGTKGARNMAITGTWTISEGADLDAQAVIQASQAISQEIVLDRLVQLLVKLALESSGARKAVLLVQADDGFAVAAIGRSEPELQVAALSPWVPLAASDDVPVSIVNYVGNARREVLVTDAVNEGLFVADPYVIRHAVRSALALPVMHHGTMNALLYLENDETPGVFTGERLALARVLLSQAAISIENARHYEELEGRVAERTQQLEAARAEAERAHGETDALLKNALPEQIAEELKATGRARPVFVPRATVLFTDFSGFTALAETLSPEELVDELEECFTFFDGVVDRWGVEKLKTIGDAYMAVGGVPVYQATHVIDCVMTGLEIVAYMDRPRGARGKPLFGVRVGVHTGPLVAGVIGRRRFAYDVWGDTVNTASRVETGGKPGRVNVSGEVWAQVQAFFVGEVRGRIAAKGKGQLEMVFIDGLRPEYRDGAAHLPNDAFRKAYAALSD